MNYEDQIAEIIKLADNVKLHLAYNHPGEAVRMLSVVLDKVSTLQEEVRDTL